MPKSLIICEKPSVARDVAAALSGTFTKSGEFLESDEYVVGFAVGHLLEQVDPDEYDVKFKRWKFEDLPILPQEFRYEARDARAKKQLGLLHKAMRRKDVDTIVNACDAGREGELIFKLIFQTSGVTKPVRRAWFSSMTRQAIRAAFDDLRDDADMQSLEAAARARSEADWLVGMNATRAATTKTGSMRSILSLGRVQTPTLAMIVRRDEEISAFVSEDYWQVGATFAVLGDGRLGEAASAIDLGEYGAFWRKGSADRVKTAEEAERIQAAVAGKPGVVAAVERKPIVEQPPLLYDLTTLQRDANQRFGFTARRTLSAAQACYDQHKVLTYPRTSSRFLSSDMVPTLKSVARHVGAASREYADAARYVEGLDVLPTGRVIADAKVTDHHAIVPTNDRHTLSALSADERKIYDLVARRYLAAFHPVARSEQTVVITEVEGETFRSRGKVLVDAGWRAAYGQVSQEEAQAKRSEEGADDDDSAERSLPPLEQGQKVTCAEAEVLAKQTKPPAHYTESSLLRSMETAGKLVDDDEAAEAMKESGLGTPATRASTIEGLIDRLYVERQGKSLVATNKAIGLVRMLADSVLTQPALTGAWEKRLADVEAGRESHDAFLEDIRKFTDDTVRWFADKDRSAMKVEYRVVGPCPNGDGDIVEKPKSYSCTSWRSKEEPGCGFTIWKTQSGQSIDFEQAKEMVAKGLSSADIKPERVVIGACPTPGCGGEIVERGKSYGCTSWKSRKETGCGFVIWKRAAGKEVSVEEAREMVAKGVTNSVPSAPAEPIGKCPTPGCGGEIIERGKSYGCSSWKSKSKPGCGFVIWKRQRGLGHEIDREEAVSLVARGLSSPVKAEEAAA